MGLGRVIEEVLAELDMSTYEAALRSGITSQRLGMLIKNDGDMHFENVRRLAAALGIDVAEISRRLPPVVLPDLPMTRRKGWSRREGDLTRER